MNYSMYSMYRKYYDMPNYGKLHIMVLHIEIQQDGNVQDGNVPRTILWCFE